MSHESPQNIRTLSRALHAMGALGLAGLLGAAIHLGLLSPAMSNQPGRNDLVRPEAKRVADLRRELAVIDRRADALQQQIDKVRLRTPDDPGEAEFLEHVSDLAKRHGVEIHQHHVAAPASAAGRWQIEITLSCSGRYDGLCKFVDAVARLPRLANVTRLSVVAAESGKYPLELTLAIYFTRDPNSKLAGGVHHG
jgi:Tfp pilus assembly protein PilO